VAGTDEPQTSDDGAEQSASEETPSEPVVAPEPVEDVDGPHPSERLQIRGEVLTIDRVPADTVPADYPVEITTEQALTVEVSIGGPDEITVVVYFETPTMGVDGRLGRLLTLAETDDPADIVGKSLLLTVEEGYYMPVVPEDPSRGDGRAVYGIGLGLLPSLLVGFVGIFAPGSDIVASTPFVLAWFVGTFLVLPISVYVDAVNLRATTDWEGSPRNWAILAVIPPINVVAIPLYLIGRENAQPLI
jgi:hypothetical protein